MTAKKHLNHALFLFGASSLSLPSANALDATQEADIEEMRVWGTQVYASSVGLDKEAIDIKQADHISDLLRSLPGVDVGGAHSLNQRITIRGMDDKDLQILIDGARQNTYMYHHMGNLQIHADILESVDIEVGTNSVVNGGIGGSVRFKTKEAKQLLDDGQRFGVRAQASGSTNASNDFSVSSYGQLSDSVDMLLYYNFIDRQNYEVGGGKILDSEGNVIGSTNGEVRGLEGELQDILFKTGWNFSENQRLKFGYESYEDSGNYSYRPDMGLATDITIADNLGLPLTYDTEFTRDTVTLNYELDWGLSNTLEASLFQNESTLWRDEAAIAELWPGSPALVEGEASNTGLNLLAESNIDTGFSHVLTYGFDLIEYETAYRSDGQKQSGESSQNLAVFLQDRMEFGVFALIPGVRYSSYDVESTVVTNDFSKVTAALAGELAVTDALLVKISTTQLFKAPDLNEVFVGAGLGEAENQNIEAEEGTNNELSVAFVDDVWGADKLAAGFTLFQTTIENHIYQYATAPAAAGGGYWYDNVGDLEIDGYEAYFSYELGAFSTLLSYSDSEAVLDAFSQYSDLDGAHDSREQGATVALSVDYRFDAHNIALHWDVQHVGSVPHYDVNLDAATLNNAKEAFTVHNISARWVSDERETFSVTVGVDNVFDEFYASQSSRTGTSIHPRFGELYLLDYEPGRNIKATLAYKL